MRLRICHATTYRYSAPVVFGPHRLMLRPRDGHDLRVLESLLTISPNAEISWRYDTFGNSVADAEFQTDSDTLSIRSDLLIERYPYDAVLFSGRRPPIALPVSYSVDDVIDLAPFMRLENPDEQEILGAWLDANFATRPAAVLSFMQALSEAIHSSFAYSRRDELGTQTAARTIESGSGTCRDFAFFFMEAVRYFGFAARFVTGYLYDQSTEGTLEGGGATHAWADVFLPNEGWVEFDPTNRITGGAALVRVATTRTPAQASPISGTFEGNGATFLDMDVSVTVTQEP